MVIINKSLLKKFVVDVFYIKVKAPVSSVYKEFYKAAPDGYIGNEDAGQMSAWYVFSALGFYPVNPAGGIYVFGSPLVEEATLNLENGNIFNVRVKNYGDKNIYIKSVKLNGQPYNEVWIKHEDIVRGGILEFIMSAKSTKWGKKSKPVPYANGKVN